MLAENRLEIADMDTATANAISAAKDVMRDRFRRRASERAAGLVEEWRREDIYLQWGADDGDRDGRAQFSTWSRLT
jgi:hypothetical protein